MILMPDDTFEPSMFEFGIGSISDDINPNRYQNQFGMPSSDPNTICFDCCESCECIWKDGEIVRITFSPCDIGIMFLPDTPTVH